MTLDILLGLDIQDIESGPLPLNYLLSNSLYYPACDIDGGVIRYCNERFNLFGICSYVYADYTAGEDRLQANINSFRGYHLIAKRILSPTDIGADKPLHMPDGIDMQEYLKYQSEWKQFGLWAVFERDKNFGELHGPERFSLIYLGAEGAATYSGLYLNNHISPKALAIIQPGTSFGFNWTDFRDWKAPLARTIRMGRTLPKYVFYGGHADFAYDDLYWPGYRHETSIELYYGKDGGRVTVWKLKNN